MSDQKRLWLAVLSLSLPVLLGAFAMDMLLPALPEMAMALRLTPGQIQWTLNVFILGFALCHLFVGMIATRLGIHVLFIVAAILYIVSSVGIALSTSYLLILALRLLQALASCTTLVISMALITQTFHVSFVTRGHSILSGVTSLGPLLAPIAGAAIVSLGGSWRSIFFALALIGSVVLALFIRRSRLFCWCKKGQVLQQSYGRLASSPNFWRYATYSSTGMCWIFLFFSATPFIVHSFYERDKWMLALVFLLASASFLAGSYLGPHLHGRRLQGRLFNRCIVIQFSLSVVLVLASLAMHLPFYAFTGWIMLMQLNCGVYFGSSISAALQQFSEIPVQAAAFQGFQQYISTFIIAGGLMMLYKHTIVDLGIMLMIVTGMSACILSSIKYRYGV